MSEKLEHRMAGREGHEMKLGGIPSRDDVAAAVGIFLEVFDDAGDLVDHGAVGPAP